jgi:cytochrome b
MAELKSYVVWDAPTRWFHWINVLCIIALAAVGLVILNANTLGVTNPGKVALKTIHAWIGYVFALNLLWRLIWAFLGNRFARWREMLPVGHAYFQAMRSYVASLHARNPEQYLGHNPLARLSVATLFALILIQAVTGLVLAGTDLFYPRSGTGSQGGSPRRAWTRPRWCPTAGPLRQGGWDSMRAFRKPFAVVHLYNFYALSVLVVLHIAAVVVTEIKEGSSIVSAMFTGRKILSRPPADE